MGARQRVILLTTVTAVLMTAALGAWQMRRASYKQTVAAEMQEKNKQPARINADVVAIKNIVKNDLRRSLINAEVHRRAELQGRWLHEYTAYLDNRQMHGRVGFFVVTPLWLAGTEDVIWVQRGYVPRDFQDRTRVPELPQNKDAIKIQGRLMAQIARTYALQALALSNTSGASSTSMSQTPAHEKSSPIWQNLPDIKLRAGMTLLPLALLQTQPVDASDTLQRDWPAMDTGVAKHHGYAFQWFALCALLVGLYVWFQLILPRRSSDKDKHE